MKNEKLKIKNGFTLVEILVVIGIIGLLAVFLVPNLLGARDRAKEAAGDSAGKIIYNYTDATQVYTLTGYKKNGISKVLELTNM
jgi:prepilin-type N-terminal cleavage/methylation domain-containing protein